MAATTVVVGANDTGKSALLEAIACLTAASPVDWSDAVRKEPGRSFVSPTSTIVGHVSGAGELNPALDPFSRSGQLRLGISSRIGGDPCLILSREQMSDLISSEWLDGDGCLEQLGTDDPREVMKQLLSVGLMVQDEADGSMWVSSGILDLVAEPLRGALALIGDPGFFGGIYLGSSRDAAWSPGAVITPLLRDLLFAVHSVPIDDPMYEFETLFEKPDHAVVVRLAEALRAVNVAIGELLAELNAAHSSSLRRVSAFGGVRWRYHFSGQQLLDSIAEGLEAVVLRSSLDTDPPGAPDEIDLGALGPGARRTIAMAAIDLYRDLSEWRKASISGGRGLTLLLIEEPETGLHASAQRVLAESLRRWATYGLQLVVVTHSPIFVNATEISGIRVARLAKGSGRRAVGPTLGLSEIRDELGVQPADILQASSFVMVEGEADRVVIDAWARTFGVDLRVRGIQLVPVHGHGLADQVARFLKLAYEGASFTVILDNGSETSKTQMEIDRRFGGTVRTVLLSRTEIEGFYSVPAIAAWLLVNGASSDGLESEVSAGLAASPKRSAALGRLADRYFQRPFDKVNDGRSIASLTLERDIDPEIKALLMGLLSPIES